MVFLVVTKAPGTPSLSGKIYMPFFVTLKGCEALDHKIAKDKTKGVYGLSQKMPKMPKYVAKIV